MNKKAMTIGESLLALILVVIVVLVFIPYGQKIWELIKISIGFGSSEESQKTQILQIQDSKNKLAEEEFNKFDDFLKNLNLKSNKGICTITFNFDTNKITSSYYFYITTDGKLQLMGGSKGPDNVLKTDNVNYIPYGDISDEYAFNQYFDNYDKYKYSLIIAPSGGFVVPSSTEKRAIPRTTSIVAVNKDNKWFLSKPYAYLSRYPICQ